MDDDVDGIGTCRDLVGHPRPWRVEQDLKQPFQDWPTIVAPAGNATGSGDKWNRVDRFRAFAYFQCIALRPLSGK
ncbi:MAG TPA: hypothetical protein PLK60_14805 [Myxococcota bacterium]|nr:hypothetical protein [Myxococcota bacterium]